MEIGDLGKTAQFALKHAALEQRSKEESVTTQLLKMVEFHVFNLHYRQLIVILSLVQSMVTGGLGWMPPFAPEPVEVVQKHKQGNAIIQHLPAMEIHVQD